MTYSLEDNWLDSFDSLKNLSSEQWIELKFPMGLVNAIKKEIEAQSSNTATQVLPPIQQ
jgi:hypothetical protein